MNSTALSKCNHCDNEYKILLGKTLNKIVEAESCPCCDPKFKMIQNHLLEFNSDYFAKLKDYQLMLDNVSDKDFTIELSQEILSFAKYELSYDYEYVKSLLKEDQIVSNDENDEKSKENHTYLEKFYAKVA